MNPIWAHVLAVVLHLGGTPRQADYVWARMRPLPFPGTPSEFYELVRDLYEPIRNDR